jgi:hypothetical protein
MAIGRRSFLLGASGVAAAQASAAPLMRRSGGSGSIMDVEHVVILMQENRSFDHYFGTLRGVRGFADPRPVMLPGGRTVWAQRGADRDGDCRRPWLAFRGRRETSTDHRLRQLLARLARVSLFVIVRPKRTPDLLSMWRSLRRCRGDLFDRPLQYACVFRVKAQVAGRCDMAEGHRRSLFRGGRDDPSPMASVI